MGKILLITPPCINLYKKTKNAAPIYPPLGLLYIASLLEKNNIEVKLIDSFSSNLNFEKIEKEIREYKPEITGITSTTSTFREVVFLASLIKKNFPDVKIVVGGPHVTPISGEILRENENIDIVVKGEGEFTFLNIVKDIPLDKIKGISFRRGNNILDNGVSERIEDLDSLPFPARHLLNIRNYKVSAKFPSLKPFTTIITSRGCPYKCSFCATSVIFPDKIRKRSAENVILEIEDVVCKFKVREIAFVDDIFTVDYKRVVKICDALKKMNLIWICNSSVNTVNEDILKIMAESGCKAIEFGIESGSERILKTIEKKITLKESISVIKLAKKYKILVSTTFIIGHLKEDRDFLKETLEFIKQIDSDILHLSLLTPYPGTEVYEIAKRENRLRINFAEYVSPKYDTPVIKLDSITPEELKKYWKKIMLAFYLKPKTIIRMIKRMFSNWDELKNIIGGFFAFISSVRK